MVKLIYTLAGAVLAAGFAIVARLVVARDRKTIAAELLTRRCRLVRARWLWTRHRPGRGRPYEVDYTDPEDGVAATTCTVRRKSISWGDDFADAPPAPLIVADTLPTYGQNWRG
jgi:hypothetical protein